MSTWVVSSTKWTAVAIWQASHAYNVGDLVRQTAGIGVLTAGNERVFRCTVAGTSGASEPSWNLTQDNTTSDNEVTWREVTGQADYGWSAPHASIWACIQSGWASGTGAQTIYFGDDHAYQWATAKSYQWPGSAANPCRLICVDDSAWPPTAVATTGSETCAGGSTVDLQLASATDGVDSYVYLYGGNFAPGTSGNLLLRAYREESRLVFDHCTFTTRGGSYTLAINDGYLSEGQEVVWLDSTLASGGTTTQIRVQGGRFTWRGGAISGTAPRNLLTLYGNYHSEVLIAGVDLSLLGASKYLVLPTNVSGTIRFDRCRLNASLGGVLNGSIPAPGALRVYVTNCDSGATNYKYLYYCYEGTVLQETTIVRTGGATDGDTPRSLKFASSSGTLFFDPLTDVVGNPWQADVGSEITVTVHVVTDGVTLTDADAWLEVGYLGNASYPLGSVATDRAADILATPANQTTSTETWTTTGLSSPVYQKLSVTFTPQLKGLLQARVCLARPDATMYVCPKVEGAGAATMNYQAAPGFIVQYGAGEGGVYTDPGEANVKAGVEYTFDDEPREGTYDPMAAAVFPAEANVSTMEAAYGPTGTEYAGELDLALYVLKMDVVAPSHVRNGTARYPGGSTGTCHVPAAADVREDVPVDATVGTLVVLAAPLFGGLLLS